VNIKLKKQKTNIFKDYLSNKYSYRELADKYSVPFSSLYQLAQREGWTDRKKETNEKVIQATSESYGDKRVSEINNINEGIKYLLPFIQGKTKKPQSYSTASRSLVELVKIRELLLGNATDIIKAEYEEKRLIQIVHKIANKGKDTPKLAVNMQELGKNSPNMPINRIT